MVLMLLALGACSDLRDFRGQWQGSRVGDPGVTVVGLEGGSTATLAIDSIDAHGLTGSLSIDGAQLTDVPIQSIRGAEADVLSAITFSGAPLRVYLAFVELPDGEALVLIALYDDHRVEVRVLRGGSDAVYAIYALAEPSSTLPPGSPR